jgi:norsolorinic acid ketoreductase
MVDTDMGRTGAAAMGSTVEAMGAISTLESVSGLLGVIDKATKETHGGKFWSYTGQEMTY